MKACTKPVQLRSPSCAPKGLTGAYLRPASTPRESLRDAHSLACDLAPDEIEGRRVLLADDEEELREVFGQLLAIAGYDVVVASGTGEALDALTLGGFDIIISDLVMPGGGGRKLLAFSAELSPGLPVVLMTGWPDEDLADELVRLGARAYLQNSSRLLATSC